MEGGGTVTKQPAALRSKIRKWNFFLNIYMYT